jgi:hypothetical protein
MVLTRNIFVVCVLLITIQTFPQAVVFGTIREKKGPVEFANVVLYSQQDTAKAVQLAVSDRAGRFGFSNITIGDYLIKTQLVGYADARVVFSLNTGESVKEIPTIMIDPGSNTLDDIEIITQKNIIKKTTQGFIVNASDNITQVGGTATDLLKNVPTVVVDAEGNITVRGKTPLILINGRNSALSNTSRIPASSVESIEIINNPSAQYDADADGGIVSIR